jgi:Tfp pilus assembly protein PilF
MKEQRMKNAMVFLSVVCLLVCRSALVYGQTPVSEQARKYFDRGMAAAEMAISPTDFESAIKEFKQAALLAPDWPDAYYNLGMVQEKAGKLSDAVTSFRQYLRLAPGASDAETVRSLINKMEYKKEAEEGIKKVYDMILLRTDKVRWLLIAKKGDNEPDWEIEHNSDFDYTRPPEYQNEALFIMKDGALMKSAYIVAPQNSLYLVMEGGYKGVGVKVSGRLFEYRYPISMIWVVGYQDGNPIYDIKREGELSIKAEVTSTDPARVKREQQIKWPNGRTSLTEFVYELRVN